MLDEALPRVGRVWLSCHSPHCASWSNSCSHNGVWRLISQGDIVDCHVQNGLFRFPCSFASLLVADAPASKDFRFYYRSQIKAGTYIINTSPP